MAGRTDANRYFKELADAMGDLSSIGETHGTDTMAHLWWLHDAILNGGRMDLEGAETAFGLAAALPSGREWISPEIWVCPLHAAADFENAKLVRLMLGHGFDARDTDGVGKTPLHYAAQAGAFGLCKLLLDHGADPAITDNDGLSSIDVAECHKTRSLLLSHAAGEEAGNLAAVCPDPTSAPKPRRL